MINEQELLAAEPAPLVFNLKLAQLPGLLLIQGSPSPPRDLMESRPGLMCLSCPTSKGLTLQVKEAASLSKQEAWENEPQINLFN